VGQGAGAAVAAVEINAPHCRDLSSILGSGASFSASCLIQYKNWKDAQCSGLVFLL